MQQCLLFLCKYIYGALHILRKNYFIYHTSWEMKPKTLRMPRFRLKLTYLCNCSYAQACKIYDDNASESFPGLSGRDPLGTTST